MIYQLVEQYSTAISMATVVLGLIMLVIVSRKKMNPSFVGDLHGSAEWASEQAIENGGFFDGGVYIGGYKKKSGEIAYLRHNGPEHLIAFAPTRSGKGVGLILPTLLSWKESCFVIDIKGENYALSAGWRKQYAKNVVLKFDPTDIHGNGARFNPLEEIRLGTEHEIQDVQNIVTMVVDPDGTGLNDHWQKTGSALLVGAILHSLYVDKKTGKKTTLKDISDLLSDPERPFDKVLNEMLTTNHKEDGPHDVIAKSAREMLNKAPNEASGVLSTALSYLSLYRDPIVAKNTSTSDFRIRDLMNHENPVSLYLIVPPSDISRINPLTRLIVNQVIRTLTSEKVHFEEGRATKNYKHRLLLQLDEFPALGKLEIFEESLAYIAGYGLKAYIIVQDLEQLYKKYKKTESIVSNCHVRIAYAPNKIETAEALSRMLGYTTIVKESVSESGKTWAILGGSYSRSYQEVKRPLLTPDEVMRLPGPKKSATGDIEEPGDMIIAISGKQPIYGKQILHFKDNYFLAASKVAAPLVSDRTIDVEPTPNGQEDIPDIPRIDFGRISFDFAF